MNIIFPFLNYYCFATMIVVNMNSNLNTDWAKIQSFRVEDLLLIILFFQVTKAN